MRLPDFDENRRHVIKQIDSLFHPSSIAVVGVPRGAKVGKFFLMALLDMGFPGKIYPVNPQAGEIDGIKAYPSVSSIPGTIDLAIILVPYNQSLSILKECAEKCVKGAVLFTAGYKETGTIEGKKLEEELVKTAHSSGMRLIGPNCMGLYCPKTGLSFFPELSRQSGPVSIISHSGSLANILGRIGRNKGIYFSKAISLGNECDLTTSDFLLYLGSDPETRVIAAYLEGIKNGNDFLNALKEVSLKKPVILWKTGLTPEGSMAATSHTGALASVNEIWKGISRQGGGIEAVGFDEWMDLMIGFSYLPSGLMRRMAIISGPGGLAVSAAEACGTSGLELAKLSIETQSKLSGFIAETGTSVKNPIDIGLTGSMDREVIISAARAAAADNNVDSICIIGTGMTEDDQTELSKTIGQIKEEFKKPVIMVTMPGFDSLHNNLFFNEGLPVFSSVERALNTYSKVLRYQKWERSVRF